MSSAAKLNAMVLQRLRKAFETDPEIDLTTVFPTNYSSRLLSRKVDTEHSKDNEPIDSNGFLPIPVPTSPATVIHPLSYKVRVLLNTCVDESLGFESADKLTEALARILKKSDLIWQSRSGRERYVAKCSSNLVVKSINSSSDFTEYTSLQFLELHRPQIPAPRPHGLITSGKSAYIFMDLVPGVTLSSVWPQLQNSQKQSISLALDSIFSDLRQQQRPNGVALGGTADEGCKDTRRHARISKTALYTTSEFWDFQYSKAPVGSHIYLEFLRRLTLPFQEESCVFTYGDVRTENILVQAMDDGDYRVSGIVDWEMSGFYPKDFECTKVTNTLATNETDDWFLYLPQCLSPARFPLKWLSDRVWDKQIV
ncbi:MAG: hypothetical protein M1829_000650 [Trizodia sp. TS-e1964]|nr:MAG: hypothetical protein M1829_000650 [Trizodia sp. TS-e1964]